MFYEDETTADALQADHEAQWDADLIQAEMEATARRLAAHEKAGFCTHQSAVGCIPEPVYKEQIGLRPGQLRCTDGCGTVFESDEAWDAASAEPELNPVPRTGPRGTTPLRQSGGIAQSGGA
ncbi:hypothetical protein AQJ46_47870 [Streptomyces canus]|uniref:Uncharacterized protein n=1 Tax=Streptomyces canus TaxID=58343 RepID=A0A101RKQ4_9ACTN|nr:hypothetical protein [Streptomyces canus]KUN57279.1 hypothetical protein AQJ46_47870 [Streptomyces canus]